MEDHAFERIEWRETEEQSTAARALLMEWAMRSALRLALACGVAAMAGAFADSLWVALGAVCPLLFAVYGLVAMYWKARSDVDRDRVGAWMAAAQAKRAETFREPALDAGDERGPARTVRIDPEGLSLNVAGQSESFVAWSAIRALRALSSGHVVVVARPFLFIPAWAFEARAQRDAFVEQARAWQRAAPPPRAIRQLPSRGDAPDAFTIELPASFELARRQVQPVKPWIVLTFIAIAFGVGYCFTRAVFAGAPAWILWTLPAAGSALTFALTTRVGQALPTWRGARRHVRHRLRFSEHGFAWASAVSSGTSVWRHAPVFERAKEIVVVRGFAIPREALTQDQIERILRWRVDSPRASFAPAELGRAKNLWVVLLPLGAVAVLIAILLTFYSAGRTVHHVGPHDYEPISDEQDRPAPPLIRPGCELGVRSTPGAPLEEDMAACAGLDAALRGARTFSPAVIEHCVAVNDRALDAAAVVARGDRLDLWLHIDRQWRRAGPLLRWSEGEEQFCDAIEISTLQLRVGGPPELLVTLDCATRLRSEGLENVASNHRYLGACGLEEGAPHCWWTLLIGEAGPSPQTQQCERWAYYVWGGATIDPTPDPTVDDHLTIQYTAGPAANAIPAGHHRIEDLERYDIAGRDVP